MFATLLSTLGAALTLWNDKEKTKYVDKLISLKDAYHAEYNKPDVDRSDAVLDNLEFELRVLALAFSSSVGGPNAPTVP